MHEFNIAIVVLAGSALFLGLLSKPLKRMGLPDSVTLLALGVLLGPAGLGWLVPEHWGEPMVILEQVARLALAIGLMGIALRLPKNYVFGHWPCLALVLGVGMPFMWLCSSGLVAITLGLPLGAALLVGAVLTPTDPVVASSVVTGPVANENLPGYLRRIISAESGANDGLAFIFIMVGVFALTLPQGESMTRHLAVVLVGDVAGSLAAGIAIGWLAGTALCKAEEKGYVEKPSMLMFTTALALTTLAGVKLLGSDGILAVFVAGLAFDQKVNVAERQEEERVVDGVDRFFTSPIFILLGLMLPWKEWLNLGWPLVLFIATLIFLRRLPLFLLLGGRTKDLPSVADSAFSGWFGPIGVAALYYAAMSHHKTNVPELWPVVSLAVAASIVVHGLTAMPFSHAYHAWHSKRHGQN